MEQGQVGSQDQEDVGSRSKAIPCALPDSEYAERLETVIADFGEGVEQIEELPDGYGMRFPGTERWIEKLVDFVAYERHCCPFFAFELAFEPAGGPVWLRLRGNGVKEFLERVEPLEGGVSGVESAQ